MGGWGGLENLHPGSGWFFHQGGMVEGGIPKDHGKA